MKQLVYWFSLIISLMVVTVNVLVLIRHEVSSPSLLASHHARLRSDFYQHGRSPSDLDSSSEQLDSAWNLHPAYSQSAAVVGGPQAPMKAKKGDMASRRKAVAAENNNKEGARRPRTLVGIITSDRRNDCSYRRRHRELFQIWNDSRVCSLAELKKAPSQYAHCQLIYTFVMGAATEPNAPTLIVNNSIPILHAGPYGSQCNDLKSEDISMLNIRENMNEGKSPTFFYFASTIMKEYHIDYAMKFDGDSIFHLHDWFLFAHYQLPPDGHGIIGGALRHKAYWKATDPEGDMEKYWKLEYDGVHLYVAGQCYFMSYDMCQVVAEEAQKATKYMEGHEDHDVSSMAFHSPRPVHLMTISKSQRFWEHPVKGQPRWERIRKRELARMGGALFEGKRLRVYTGV